MIMVAGNKQPYLYVHVVKEMLFKNEHEELELHGAGDKSITSLASAVATLTKYKYVVVTRLKTKTLHGREEKMGKLIVHLKKAPDFDEIYKQFEAERAEKAEKRNQEASKTHPEESEEEAQSKKRFTSPVKETQPEGDSQQEPPKETLATPTKIGEIIQQD